MVVVSVGATVELFSLARSMNSCCGKVIYARILIWFGPLKGWFIKCSVTDVQTHWSHTERINVERESPTVNSTGRSQGTISSSIMKNACASNESRNTVLGVRF